MARLQKASLQQASIRRTNFQKTTVATLVLATCLSTAAAFAETKKEYRFTVGPNANVSVDTQYGAISVMPGSANQVVVTATLKSDNVEVDKQQNGNRIQIASHLLKGTDQQMGRVDYELLIPPDAIVNLRSSTGPLSAERLQGDLTLEGADAVVNIRNVSNGHVHVLRRIRAAGRFSTMVISAPAATTSSPPTPVISKPWCRQMSRPISAPTP